MAEILIYDVIGKGFFEDGVTPESVHAQIMEASGEDILVRINSPGGLVADGITIMNLLAGYSGSVDISIDGLAASAATIVALGGERVTMANGSRYMIHDPWGATVGNADEHAKSVERLNATANDMAELYASRIGGDADKVRAMMREEVWLSALEAVEMGFADGMAEGVKSLACKVPSEFGYRNTPKNWRQSSEKNTTGMAQIAANIRQRKIDLTRQQMKA